MLLPTNFLKNIEVKFWTIYCTRTFILLISNISLKFFSNEFAKADRKTMVWKKDESLPLGGDVMSPGDVIKLNTYYKCSNFPTLKPSPGN